MRYTRIVARGGSLSRDVVLCVTREISRDGFVGRGSIPAEVFDAFPRLACRGRAEAFDLDVERDPTTGHAAFSCKPIPLNTSHASSAASADAGAPARDAGRPRANAPSQTSAPQDPAPTAPSEEPIPRLRAEPPF